MAQHNSKTPEHERDRWRTPQWLFRWLDQRFRFDVDLAADADNALKYEYCTKDDDALSLPWSALWRVGFVNPPYSDIDPWVKKAVEEQAKGFTTVMIFPTPNGEDRFAQVFARASEIIDIIGRVAFLRPDGTPVSGNTRGTAVYVFCSCCRGKTHRWWISRDILIAVHGDEAGVAA